MSALTIVMYHYVRPIAASLHPRIRGLECAAFEGQLDYIGKHYRVVSVADLIRSRTDGPPLPERPLILSFDDGYGDHYRHVLPALLERGMTGVFFPPARAVVDRQILDVNMIHFLLACMPDHEALAASIEREIAAARVEFALPAPEEYRRRWRHASRFDPEQTIFVKRMLQHALPQPLRRRILRALFQRYVSRDEAGFADALYVTEPQLREMVAAGMEVGSHGDAHEWLDRLSPQEQAADIDRSLALLDRIGVARRGFSFCYPYGAYTPQTVELLRARDCAAAFTTRVALADAAADDLLALPRLDTNDLPTDARAAPVEWTVRAGWYGQ